MRKTLIILILFLTFAFSSSCSCNGDVDYYTEIKEYTGTKVKSIQYKYFDDYSTNIPTKIAYLDFDENKYYNNIKNDEKILHHEFTEQEEKQFIDGVYSAGLFNIRKEYIYKISNNNSENEFIEVLLTSTINTFTYNLVIEFEDGSVIESRGENDLPIDLFNRCSIYFYMLCREEVLGTLPYHYFDLPDAQIFIDVQTQYPSTNSDFTLPIHLSNYIRRYKELKNNLYELHEEKYNGVMLLNDETYVAKFDTSNLNKKEFKKIEIKMYDYNSMLSNETTIVNTEWFDIYEIQLEFNKIYSYKVYYTNDDYFEYSFHTLSGDILSQYHYKYQKVNSDNDSNAYLLFDNNNKFELVVEDNGVFYSKCSGSYVIKYELVNDKKYRYIYLYMNDSEKYYLVCDFTNSTLDVITNLSTVSLDRYGIRTNNEEINKFNDYKDIRIIN